MAGRCLALLLHLNGERAGEAIGAGRDQRRILAFEYFLWWGVPHEEGSAGGERDRHKLEIGLSAERANLQLTPADNRQSRRLYPADPDDRALTAAQQDGGRASE